MVATPRHLRDNVLGRDEVNVVALCLVLQPEHELRELMGLQLQPCTGVVGRWSARATGARVVWLGDTAGVTVLPTVWKLGDVPVLAKHASHVAAGKENRAGAVPSWGAWVLCRAHGWRGEEGRLYERCAPGGKAQQLMGVG